MTCASVTIRLRGLMYVNLANQSVTYVSGTFVTLDSGLNKRGSKGDFLKGRMRKQRGCVGRVRPLAVTRQA